VSGEYCYLYDPEAHKLTLHMTGDGNNLQNRLHAASGQEHLRAAPGVFVITSNAQRVRFNQEYGVQEAGHAAQNLLLQAAALGLGAVPVGSFTKEDVQSHLALETKQYPVTLVPVGHVSA
jgi:SagB-type dehydrogenase family enzyme